MPTDDICHLITLLKNTQDQSEKYTELYKLGKYDNLKSKSSDIVDTIYTNFYIYTNRDTNRDINKRYLFETAIELFEDHYPDITYNEKKIKEDNLHAIYYSLLRNWIHKYITYPVDLAIQTKLIKDAKEYNIRKYEYDLNEKNKNHKRIKY
jgi:hypothetical protein